MLIASAFTPSASCQVVAQPQIDEKVVYRKAVENTIALIRENVPPHLDNAERERFLTTTFLIEDDNMRYSGFRAEPAEQTVHIPLSFLILADQLEFAMQIHNVAKLPPEQLTAYMKRFVVVLRYNADPLNRNRTKKPFPIYQHYVQLSDAQIHAIVSTADFQNAHIFGKVSGLSFILLHEFAHLSGIVDEDKADDFAIERAQRTDISIFGAIWSFLIHAYIEESIGIRTGSHLPAFCRVAKLAQKAIALHQNDEGFVVHMQSADPTGQWRTFPNQIEKLLGEEGIDCTAPAAELTVEQQPAEIDRWPTSAQQR